MPGSTQRVLDALSHRRPDRTPLFEIFQPFHPIYWDVCGRTIATDMALAWDAMADGTAWEDFVAAQIDAQYRVARFFGLDMVRLNAPVPNSPDAVRPVKTGKTSWTLGDIAYRLNSRTKMVEVANPGEAQSYSHRLSEEAVRRRIESWNGAPPGRGSEEKDGAARVLRGVQQRAKADGIDWVYMAEIGAGTGVSFYPPFMLMWMIEEPDLLRRWLDMQKASAFPRTRRLIEQGCRVVAMGGDVSCDKGPFISPRHYHEFILPVIREHVSLIHEAGAGAVYTADGNHWAIKDDFFFASGIDGYKEVDKAAGMTWPRLIEEGVADRVCIIGNMDARHTMCLGTVEEVKRETVECLRYGLQSAGGHILHLSHSVHEDVKAENYCAMVDAYRQFFGMDA
jgi:hypothetical protein